MIEKSQKEIMKMWPENWAAPIVSVRCTTYNQEKYIAKALDSFLMQVTDFPFEIVVHDDASTDRTAEVIREYEANYPQIIKPIYETENQLSKRNGSLRRIVNEACKGEYIAFCEGDDYWIDEKKLQKQYDAMKQHPECSLCTHVVQCVSENETVVQRQYPSKGLLESCIIEQDVFAEFLIAKSLYPFQTSSYFLRKSLLDEADAIWSFPANGDDKILRLCLNNGKVYFVNEAMSCYRTWSNGSWTCRNFQVKEKRLNAILNLMKLNQKFDAYSQYKFHNFVKSGEKRLQIKMFVCNNQFKELFKPEFRDSVKQSYSSREYLKFYILSKLPNFLADAFLHLLKLRVQLMLFLKRLF